MGGLRPSASAEAESLAALSSAFGRHPHLAVALLLLLFFFCASLPWSADPPLHGLRLTATIPVTSGALAVLLPNPLPDQLHPGLARDAQRQPSPAVDSAQPPAGVPQPEPEEPSLPDAEAATDSPTPAPTAAPEAPALASPAPEAPLAGGGPTSAAAAKPQPQLYDPARDRRPEESCREVCLGEVNAPAPQRAENETPRFWNISKHIKMLDKEVIRQLLSMHDYDLNELLRRAIYEVDARYTKKAQVNAAFKEYITSYQAYRVTQRNRTCDDGLWQSFVCPHGRRISGIRINHLTRDSWKLARVQRSACMAGFEINWTSSVWHGVIGKERPEVVRSAVQQRYILDPQGFNLGNVGAALSHITLWEALAKEDPGAIFLAMEDNALFTPESLSGMCKAMEAAGDFDVLNLSVLRPRRGKVVNRNLGLYEVPKTSVKEPMPNVWMSSYLVTGRGASKLLKCLQKKSHNMGQDSEIIDRIVSKQCLHGEKGLKAYIVDHHRFFGHVETGGDSRKEFNNRTVVRPKANILQLEKNDYVCAPEASTCKCTGEVKFGVDLHWTAWKPVVDNVTCGLPYFGKEDPAFGVAKACVCRPSASTAQRRADPPAVGVLAHRPKVYPSGQRPPMQGKQGKPMPNISQLEKDEYVCAHEASTCNCTGVVKFGVDLLWTAWQPVLSSMTCSLTYFGKQDPAFGVPKACVCRPSASTGVLVHRPKVYPSGKRPSLQGKPLPSTPAAPPHDRPSGQ